MANKQVPIPGMETLSRDTTESWVPAPKLSALDRLARLEKKVDYLEMEIALLRIQSEASD